DVTVAEGDSGTANAVFTVSRNGGSSGTVTVDYATANGTAIAGTDYLAQSGSLTFASGQTSRTITVLVNGNTVDQVNRTFFVNLTNSVAASILDDEGQGTITDDDGPTIAIDDVTLEEGDSGTTNAVFTVSL